MKEFNYTITDELGIHARPAGTLVKFISEQLSSKVSISFNERTVDASRLFALLGLAVKCGDTITFIVDGEQAENDAKSLEEFCGNTL